MEKAELKEVLERLMELENQNDSIEGKRLTTNITEDSITINVSQLDSKQTTQLLFIIEAWDERRVNDLAKNIEGEIWGINSKLAEHFYLKRKEMNVDVKGERDKKGELKK